MSVNRKYMESHLQMTEYVNEHRMDVSVCKFNLTTLKSTCKITAYYGRYGSWS